VFEVAKDPFTAFSSRHKVVISKEILLMLPIQLASLKRKKRKRLREFSDERMIIFSPD